MPMSFNHRRSLDFGRPRRPRRLATIGLINGPDQPGRPHPAAVHERDPGPSDLALRRRTGTNPPNLAGYSRGTFVRRSVGR